MPSVTRSPRRARASRHADAEGALLAATEALLAEGNGFTELSVERLIRRAGVARSTFYAYFDDKGHLVRRLAETVMLELESAARSWWEIAVRAEPGDITNAVGEILDSYARHRPVYEALLETATYDPLVAAEYRSMMDGFTRSAVEVIERGQAAGVMRELPVAETAGALTWMVERSAQQIMREGGRDRLAQALANVIWRTLYEAEP